MKNFDFKVGDKVYCYKDNNYIHKKGNYYEIKDIYKPVYDDRIYIAILRNDKYLYYYVDNNFCDYFISERKYRELKLKQLNERV